MSRCIVDLDETNLSLGVQKSHIQAWFWLCSRNEW